MGLITKSKHKANDEELMKEKEKLGEKIYNYFLEGIGTLEDLIQSVRNCSQINTEDFQKGQISVIVGMSILVSYFPNNVSREVYEKGFRLMQETQRALSEYIERTGDSDASKYVKPLSEGIRIYEENRRRLEVI